MAEPEDFNPESWLSNENDEMTVSDLDDPNTYVVVGFKGGLVESFFEGSNEVVHGKCLKVLDQNHREITLVLYDEAWDGLFHVMHLMNDGYPEG